MSSTRNPLVRRSAGARGGNRRSTAEGGRGSSEGRRTTFAGRRTRRAGDGEDGGFLSLTPERGRALLFVAARTPTTALVVITAVVLVVLLSADGGFDGISGAIAASWLGAHQVPLVIGKTHLSLLPLLPTLFLLWLTGRDCARAVEPDSTRADLAWLVGAALSGPLLVTAVCLAVAEDASAVVALQPPDAVVAFTWVIGLYLVAITVGIASTDRRPVLGRLRAPAWVVAGAGGAGRTVVRLLGCASALTVASLLMHWSRIGDTYATSGNFAGVLGLTLLSLAYVPNAVVGAVGVLVGSGMEFGTASIGVFSVVGGPIPAVPLSAVLPSGPAAGWWLVLLLIPAGVGVLGGIDAARTSPDQLRSPWSTLTSAGLATLGLVLCGAIAGGELGTFGYVGLDLPIFAAVTFLWLAVAGYAGLVFGRLLLVPVGVPAYEPEPDLDDYDDYRDHDDYDDDPDYDDYHDEHVQAHYRAASDDRYDDDDDYDHRDATPYDAGLRYRADSDDRAEPDRTAIDLDDIDTVYSDDYDNRPLDAELLDERPAATFRPPRSAPPPDIVDAEVVETDADDRKPTRGR